HGHLSQRRLSFPGLAARSGLGARHHGKHGGGFRRPGEDEVHRRGGLGPSKGQEGQDGRRHGGHEPRLPGGHGNPRRLSGGIAGKA
ncbi:unnamed protein product, partial [Ectocarpus sp. 8 AP-2014]